MNIIKISNLLDLLSYLGILGIIGYYIFLKPETEIMLFLSFGYMYNSYDWKQFKS